MKKTVVLELLKRLRLEFKESNKLNSNRGVNAIHKIMSLIERGYIPIDSDVCVVNVSSYSKSIIDGSTSPTENSKHYKFYVELNNQVVSQWVIIEHHDVDLLMKLYRTLMLFKLKRLY